MIYFLIGTKAQLIKMFPLMRELLTRGLPYRYIDTVQHGPLCERIRAVLDIREPDHYLAPPGTQIESTRHAVAWSIGVIARALRQRKTIFPTHGLVLVHGDTLSTLIGLVIGKLCGQQVCHVEAGERTHRLMRPFPEEIIRRIVDRYSNLLLACGNQQFQNIEASGNRKPTVNLGYNTLLDAVQTVAKTSGGTDEIVGGSILVSIHRFETITSRKRMEFVVATLELLAKSEKVVFGLHPPTRNKLEEFELMKRLEQIPSLQLRGLFDYPDFVRTLRACKFIITDGGGPQEESYFLGVPCLLLRSETERDHPNVFMPQWNLEKVDWFSKNAGTFARPPLNLTSSAATKAVDSILEHVGLATPVQQNS